MYLRVNRDVVIQLTKATFGKYPYDLILNDEWSEVVVNTDLRGLTEFKDGLEEFINEETDRGQSGPNSAPNRLPAKVDLEGTSA